MIAPTNHTVIVTIPDDKRMRGNVVAVKRLGPGVANLLIETHDVLNMGEYPATYHTPIQEAVGTFKVFRIGTTPNMRWRAAGIFMKDKKRRW